MSSTFILNLGKLSVFISQIFRWLLIIIAMTAIGVGTAGIATFWGLLIVKFLQKTITFNTSVYKEYISFKINNDERADSIIEKYKDFLKASKRKFLYNLILFIIFFIGFLNSFTIADKDDKLLFKIIFGVFSLLVLYQFFYLKLAKKEIDKKVTQRYNDLKEFMNLFAKSYHKSIE
ncbi:hypothetical protein CYV15_02645 [Riemerella anatipestifer]|uniref:hypothetical protein n=1 Tax=Riemerella anatipestifer TaxID=34085 RepID=UPI000D1444CF|nr:hypothetical protein [Riemerella anatipestifer]PST44622.1 hypothetical protein CYV15_02645 [Riemerella anatipestifer]